MTMPWPAALALFAFLLWYVLSERPAERRGAEGLVLVKLATLRASLTAIDLMEVTGLPFVRVQGALARMLARGEIEVDPVSPDGWPAYRLKTRERGGPRAVP